jgi:hypothetical protein
MTAGSARVILKRNRILLPAVPSRRFMVLIVAGYLDLIASK